MTTRMKNFMGGKEGRKEGNSRERERERQNVCVVSTRKKETKWTETTKKEVRKE